MRVAVVGAGISGIAAAMESKALGHSAIVFDSHTAPGGRLATLRADGYVVDMGATILAPKGRLLEHVMLSGLDTAELRCIRLPIYTHTALRPAPGDPARSRVERFAYKSGNDTLAALLSSGIEMRLGQTVLELDRRGSTFLVCQDEFDAVIVTPPAPEAARLLATIGQHRSLANCTYRMCLSVALAFDKPMPARPYFALVDPLQRHPLTWISFESAKCEGRAPEGHTALVAQLSAEFSSNHMSAEDGSIISQTLGFVERLLGHGWDAPVLAKVYRWPYSHPENIGLFDSVNHPGSRVLVAGDGLAGARVEYAYEVGVRTARLLTEAT